MDFSWKGGQRRTSGNPNNVEQPCSDLGSIQKGKIHEKLDNINEHSIWLYLINLFQTFSWILWNIISRRNIKSGSFWNCPEKIAIKAHPVDQISWIKFRGPEMNEGSSLPNFRFVGLTIGSQSAGMRICSELNSEATRNFPGPEKIPRASFGLLYCLPKFYHKLKGKKPRGQETRWQLVFTFENFWKHVTNTDKYWKLFENIFENFSIICQYLSLVFRSFQMWKLVVTLFPAPLKNPTRGNFWACLM